jgi:hypothetical protein
METSRDPPRLFRPGYRLPMRPRCRQGRRLSSLQFDGDGIEIRYYAPSGEDRQTCTIATSSPRDLGSGRHSRGERVPFGPGDMIFAGAGEEHRFVDFTADFATWVLFYGPRKA